MKISTLIIDFLEYLELEKNASQKTISNYDHYLKRFLDFAGDIDVTSVDNNIIRNYRLYLSRYKDPLNDKSLKRVTQNFFLIAMRSFLKYLAKRDIKVLSAEKIELGSHDPSPIKVLDIENIARLLSAPDVSNKEGIRDRTILEMLFSTGLRVSELAALNRDDVNLNRREFSVVGKGGKERIVFLSDSCSIWLEKYFISRKDEFTPLFIRFAGRIDSNQQGEAMRLSARSIERVVEKYVKVAGLSVKATPHTFRHSFATDLLINGADIRSVQEMLGHANISTTQIYTHITNQQLRQVHKTFHSKNLHNKSADNLTG